MHHGLYGDMGSLLDGDDSLGYEYTEILGDGSDGDVKRLLNRNLGLPLDTQVAHAPPRFP